MDDEHDKTMADAPPLVEPSMTEGNLDAEFPNRPHNHSETLPFHDLLLKLFDPLNGVKAKPKGAIISRAKIGPHGPVAHSPHEARRIIIERFISLWRQKVGHDIYPAFRLILPERDRDCPVYGLKESRIASILVKVLGLARDSEDAVALLKWKVPGRTAASQVAGDFAGRCYEVIKKRPVRTEVGNMTISEVNRRLDLLAAEKEEGQRRLFQEFYRSMNAAELQWLIRIILRQMKIGATEKTFFDIWHPNAQDLFNTTSSLRRVCWELFDPKFRLEGEDVGIALMQCFQPQLARYQMHSMQKVVETMHSKTDDQTFWIEEKLDGERMQMHMATDDTIEGGKRFQFWSRQGKDYNYLYGSGLYDDSAALTRHLNEAFDERVDDIILDGEMITWDPEQGALVAFGTLKTAALAEQRNPFSVTGHRPVFKIFDILYLNGKTLTQYSLRDRRKALQASVRDVNDRFHIHSYTEGRTAADIERLLHEVIATASEGLVVKNPQSVYQVNERNDDWIKVKPEYMTEGGESMDCIVLGGYYGAGRRGGHLASFLCGLKADEREKNPMKFHSFFKVGGGLRAADYAAIFNKTHGKWKTWDRKKPPTEFVELEGGKLQYERPDEWIRPDESVVLEVKAASINPTHSFRAGFTLRFPRFMKLREDKDWNSAMSLQDFMEVKSNIDTKNKEKELKVDDFRKKRQRTTAKKPLKVVGGGDDFVLPYDGAPTDVFKGLNFFIMTESPKPNKKSKEELQQLVKANGGSYFQTFDARPNTICIADRRVIKAASLQKSGTMDIVRPLWLIDCVKQAEIDRGKPTYLLPLEPKYMMHTTPDSSAVIEQNTDEYGDSYAKDVAPDELREIFSQMPTPTSLPSPSLLPTLSDHNRPLKSHLFSSLKFLVLFPDPPPTSSSSQAGSSTTLLLARFARATILHPASITSLSPNSGITHVIISDGGESHSSFTSTPPAGTESTISSNPPSAISDQERVKKRRDLARQVRERIADWGEGVLLPRVVGEEWVEVCWKEGTRVDEEGFVIF